MIVKIVSGGQTGADRGGLRAAIACGIPHGGWCPKGRKAEDGRIPDLYTLQETAAEHYAHRTEQNVLDSDATLVFSRGRAAGGSLLTIALARHYEKPWHTVDLAQGTREEHIEGVVAWLSGGADKTVNAAIATPPSDCVLNVAGSRESESPDIEETVAAVMIDVVRKANK